MNAMQAAQLLHDWAFAAALIPDGPLSPCTSNPVDFNKIQGITDNGVATLRARQIQSLAFNVQDNEVTIFVKRSIPMSKKVREALPHTVDGSVQIKYRQGVQAPIGTTPQMPHGGPTYRVRAVGGLDRYTCGSSISVGNDRDAGTLGCLVADGAGEIFGLSNNHVCGSCSFAPRGLPIVAPGIFDVAPASLPPFTIGFFEAALPLVSGSADNVDPSTNIDVAIFRVADPSKVTSFQKDVYDTPAIVGSLMGGQKVEKVGRTTGHTHGLVVGQMHGVISIPYHAVLYGFNGPVFFSQMFAIVGVGDVFSDSGDSGSLITSMDPAGNRVAVGIVVGGMADAAAPGGKLTLALPIAPALQQLGLTLVSGHNI